MNTRNSRNGRTLPLVNLAIDLDGVLTEHPRPLAIAASSKFGLDLPERAFVDSAGLNVPQAVRDWVYADDGPAAQLQPAEGAQDFVAKAMELLGASRVRILTARAASNAEMTHQWLQRHSFPAIEVTFADDKATVATQIGITHAVEDSLRHARSYADSGLDCFLIIPAETSVEIIDGVTPVSNFADLYELLQLEVERHCSGAQIPDHPMPSIVIADAIHPAAREYLERFATLIEIDGTDRNALFAVLPLAEALIVRSETQVTADVISAAPHLRVVARAGVGVDNIDLDAATNAGVLVLNAPGANRYSAGEHTVALLLGVTRQLAFANASTHAGQWERKNVKPIDLRGRTVGIVGLGRVGSVVARILQAFEMRVIAYDPFITPERFEQLGVEAVDYESLLREVDVVTFHVPSTPVTHHMLDEERLELMRPEAIVINASRGDVVDEVALAQAIRTNRIAGAGVDVFPHEPCLDSPLFNLPNVLLTPHTGGSSAEALRAVGDMISTSVIAALNGQAVPNAVNLPSASIMAQELQQLTMVAGAAGHLLAVLQASPPALFRITVNGVVPEDVTEHVTNAALSEALNIWTNHRVTPVNARIVAEQLGLSLRINSGTRDASVLPSFSFEASGEPEETAHQVRVSWDRHEAAIVAVDRFTLDRGLAGELLITHHHDVPGVIGRVGTILGRYEVNIAGMEVGRHLRGGEAIMVVNVDGEIPEGALQEIHAIPGLERAMTVSLPRDLKRSLHGTPAAIEYSAR